MLNDSFYAIACVLIVTAIVLLLMERVAVGGSPRNPRRVRLHRAQHLAIVLAALFGLSATTIERFASASASRPVSTSLIVVYALAWLVVGASFLYCVLKEATRRSRAK